METGAGETWSGTAARAGGLLSLVTLLGLGPAAADAPAQEGITESTPPTMPATTG